MYMQERCEHEHRSVTIGERVQASGRVVSSRIVSCRAVSLFSTRLFSSRLVSSRIIGSEPDSSRPSPRGLWVSLDALDAESDPLDPRVGFGFDIEGSKVV